VINNTRLIKLGMDGVVAAVIEIVFTDGRSKPKIRSSFQPCPKLKLKTDQSYDVLLPICQTMLALILPQYMPLTSKNSCGSVTTMGKLICSMLKEALRQSFYNFEGDDSAENGNMDFMATKKVNAVILMGGNIRASEDYPEDAFFSLETLEAEIMPSEVVGFVDMPGHVLAAGIESIHSGPPIPGWFQYDDGITQDPVTKHVLTVSGKPIARNRIYCVATTKAKDLTNRQR
jgi:hypothetical protein